MKYNIAKSYTHKATLGLRFDMDGHLITLIYQNVVDETMNNAFPLFQPKFQILQNFSSLSVKVAELEPRAVKICPVVWETLAMYDKQVSHNHLAFGVWWCAGYDSQLLPPFSISKTDEVIIISVLANVALC